MTGNALNSPKFAQCDARIVLPRLWARARLVLMAATALFATTAQAQYGSIEQRERQELLARISQSIRVTPDYACALPEDEIRSYLTGEVNRYGLIDNVDATVFGRSSEKPLSGYAALLAKTQQETERKHAESQRIYRGEEAPVGRDVQPTGKSYYPEVYEISAVGRIENGLNCVANVRVGQLRFPVAYDLYLDPGTSDGWTARFTALPTFTEAAALADTTAIRISYDGALLTLLAAREQGSRDRASAIAARKDAQRQEAARTAYENSPAGRAEAFRQRQAMAEKQKACEARGGTWGVRFDGQTIMRVEASEADGLLATLQACYFLGQK